MGSRACWNSVGRELWCNHGNTTTSRSGPNAIATGCRNTPALGANRILANNGNVPTNIGLDGGMGGEWNGKWYGGTFGWNFDATTNSAFELDLARLERRLIGT